MLGETGYLVPRHPRKNSKGENESKASAPTPNSNNLQNSADFLLKKDKEKDKEKEKDPASGLFDDTFFPFKLGQEASDKFEAGSAALPTSTVEISISCRDLLNKDLLSKSDPVCVVYHRPPGSSRWVEFLRTETIQNCLNPDFATKVTMEYHFEECQMIRFEVYDIDKPAANLSVQDYLGSAECTLAQIVSGGSKGLILPLNQAILISTFSKERTAGTIILIAEELASLKDEITFRITGRMVASVNCCFLSPKTYYVLSKINTAGGYIIVYRSEISKGRDPIWRPMTITLRSMCNGDKDRGLKIECYQIGIRGSHSPIGFCETSLNQMVALGKDSDGEIKLNPYDPRSITGSLMIQECKISPIYTFVDYIQNGTQIHCCFAIDFTSSNGDPKDPCSLHHFSTGSGNPNPYEQAIQSVGRILQDYDQNKLFPVYGFGARIPPNGAVSHNFFVTLTDAGYCYGITGVLEGYRNCIRRIQLYGPTNFAPVIKHVTELASQNQNGEHYFILIIITDGVITDMPQTKEAIIEASAMPVSIIIVAVGGADFEAMEELDGDAVRITYNKKTALRDIVQFVPYRDAHSWMNASMGKKTEAGGTILESLTGTTSGVGESSEKSTDSFDPQYKKAKNDATYRMAQIKLAKEILAEIPEQLSSYMKNRGLFPLNIRREKEKERGKKVKITEPKPMHYLTVPGAKQTN